MSDHAAAVCHAGYYRLRQLRPTVKSLPVDAARTLIHRRLFQTAWVTATLLSVASLTPCWRSAFGSECSGLARPTHTNWQTRTHFTSSETAPLVTCQPSNRLQAGSVTVLMYQISRGLAPTCLQDRCRLASKVSSSRRLRSANVPTFVVPRTRTKLGDRSFAAAGPRLWNSLPGPLRQSETLTTFKRQTFLFSD